MELYKKIQLKVKSGWGLNWMWIIDYIVIPILMFLILYDANFMHGFIDYFEAGKELACLNEMYHGKLLYKDTIPYFGPLTTYLQMFSMFLFGKSIAVLRGFFYFGTIFTLIVGYFIALKLCQRKIFAYTAALFLIVESYHPFWATCWGGFRFGFGLLAILCLISFLRREKIIWVFFAGIFTSIAFLVTLDVGVLCCVSIGLTLFFYTLYSYLRNKRVSLKFLIIYVLGQLIVLIPFVIYFAFTQSLLPYVNTILTIATNHGKVWSGGQGSPDFRELTRLTHVYTMGFKQVIPILLYLYLGIHLTYRMFKKTMFWRDYGVMCLSIYGLLVYITSLRALLGPQFQMALQPFTILWFILLDEAFWRVGILRKHKISKSYGVKYITVVVLFMFMISYPICSEKRFYGDLKNWSSYQKYKKYVMPMYIGVMFLSRIQSSILNINRAKGLRVPSNEAVEIEGVTNYIISVTKPGECVFAFPEHSIYNFLADRPCIDRFSIPGFAWTTPEWREELLADLKKVNPTYIIYGTKLSNMAMCINREEELLPDVITYIHSHYHKEASFGTIVILRRKQ